MKIAIFTTYFPNQENVLNVKMVSEQVDNVVICDNSPTTNQAMFNGISNLVYYFFDANLGISSAFNQAINNLKNQLTDDTYLIFFDQDSSIRHGHIDSLINDYETLLSSGYKVGCLGPVYFEKNSNKLLIQKQKKELLPNIYSVKSIITSSLICKYSFLKDVGFWNEDVFLDMADWDLCWRFIQKKYLCCVTKNTILEHTLGEKKEKKGLIQLKVGAPYRNYYQVRESLYLFKKSYTPLKFKIIFILNLIIRNPLRLVFLNNRREQLYYMNEGFKDYKKHKTGPITHYY